MGNKRKIKINRDSHALTDIILRLYGVNLYECIFSCLSFDRASMLYNTKKVNLPKQYIHAENLLRRNIGSLMKSETFYFCFSAIFIHINKCILFS